MIMKRIIFVASALLLMSMQIMAQKFFDVYQNGKAAASIPTTSIDSIGLTGMNMQDRKVNFYRNDKIVNSFPVNAVDSIKIFRPDDEQLVYLGIIGFNQNLYEKSLDVLAKNTSGLYTKYVDSLERKDGTLLYYAVDQALNRLSSMKFPTPLSNVFFITFTDGLDQGSLMMNGNYYSDEQYLNAVNNRIHNIRVKGLPITAYSLGLLDDNVSDYTLFQNNIKKLASSTDNAFEVSSMGKVRTRLQELSNMINSIINRQTISFRIPGRSNGTLIRLTLDGYSAENSKMYIEGTFDLANRTLTNVTYHGIKATSGSYVQGTQDGIFVTFTFTGMQREDGDGLISQANISEFYKTSGSSSWQQNSGFSPSNNTHITNIQSGAAIMLVLDSSNTLGALKNSVQEFINNVADNIQDFIVEAPQNVTVTLKDNFEVVLNWDAAKHAEHYDVLRGGPSPWGEDDYDSWSTIAGNITSTTWTDKTPLGGSNYYKVIAYGHGLDSYDFYSAPLRIFVNNPLCPDSNHPHMIDLGLPSGTKWACCNVGADKPVDYGGYFAWGETSEKARYYWDTYIHCDGSYSTCHDIGKDIAGTQYDTATANWGSPWVMPNGEQILELLGNCNAEKAVENGVKGYRFNGPNGASIFLPIAGSRYEDDFGRYPPGSQGFYWSSTRSEQYKDDAMKLNSFTLGSDSRCAGLSVRPVRKK